MTTRLDSLRVDQGGSLVPPKRLRDAYKLYASGEIDETQLRVEQDAAIVSVIRKQEAVGLPIVTDGEFRRSNFQESFGKAVSGFDVPERVERINGWREPMKPWQRSEQNFGAVGPAILTRRGVVGRLKLRKNLILDEYQFVSDRTKVPAKVTLIGPDRISQRFDVERSKEYYGDIDEFIADVVAIEREMIQQLVDAGCRYVHIDSPGFTAYADTISLERMRARGEDPQKNLARAIKAENDVIAGFDGVTFGVHICRGNTRAIDPKTGKVVPQWHREGHYDAIAEQLFSELKHQRLLLEYDSERAGDFSPLRFVREGSIAVLGLVTTKSENLEDKEMLKRRIDDATRQLPLEQLALSPQCGFSSDMEIVDLDEDTQWRKFERIREVAMEVWGST